MRGAGAETWGIAGCGAGADGRLWCDEPVEGGEIECELDEWPGDESELRLDELAELETPGELRLPELPLPIVKGDDGLLLLEVDTPGLPAVLVDAPATRAKLSES